MLYTLLLLTLKLRILRLFQWAPVYYVSIYNVVRILLICVNISVNNVTNLKNHDDNDDDVHIDTSP